MIVKSRSRRYLITCIPVCLLVHLPHSVPTPPREAYLSTLYHIRSCITSAGPVRPGMVGGIALLTFKGTGEFKKETVAEYWWKYVQEGLEMGKKIERIIQDHSKEQA
jgi:hypothetical protein